MKTTYYNHVSVRDQVLPAESKLKCELDYGKPRNVPSLDINKSTWIATCTDPCTPGFCPVHVFVFIPKITIPQTINLYFVKKSNIAYISFTPEVLSVLIQKGILNTDELQVEKNAPKILPNVLTDD